MTTAPKRSHLLKHLVLTFAITTVILPIDAQNLKNEWRSYGNTDASTKYSSLDQINANNVKDLRIAWQQSAVPMEMRKGRESVPLPTNWQVTPIMAGGL